MDQSPYRWCGEGEPGLCSGGLLRNEYGEWLAAFASRVGICTSVKAELLAVKHGLELAWSLGYRRIIFEVDSQVVLLILGKPVTGGMDPLVLHITCWPC